MARLEELKRGATVKGILPDGFISSVTTGTSAVSLNPLYISALSWWEHPRFDKTVGLKAAELIAFEVLNPVLRSRAGLDVAGQELINDQQFAGAMRELLSAEPTGRVTFPTLSEAFRRIETLEKKLERIEKLLQKRTE